MLYMKFLTITHKGDVRDLTKDFSLTINKGVKLHLLIRRNGNYILLKLIYDYKLIEGYIEYTGNLISMSQQ